MKLIKPLTKEDGTRSSLSTSQQIYAALPIRNTLLLLGLSARLVAMPTDEHRTHTGPGTQLSPSQLAKLSRLNLYFNSPEPAIICKGCGYAITADKGRVSRHLGEIHQFDKLARRGLNKLIRSLNLPDPKDLCPRPDGSIPHPHLKSSRESKQ